MTTQTAPLPGESYDELIDAQTPPPVDDRAVEVVAATTFPVQQRPADTWQTGKVTVPATFPLRVLDARPSRVAAVLKFASDVVLAPTAEQAQMLAGFPTSYAEIGHRSEVWACSPSGDVTGYWSAEYVDG